MANKKSSKVEIYCSYDKKVEVETLIPHPLNPNTHPQKQVLKLAQLIRLHGIRHPITVSNRSGFIIAGHCRLLAAKELSLTHFPVDYQDFENEAQEWAVLVSDNVVQEFAEIDGQLMADGLVMLDEAGVSDDLPAYTSLDKDQIDDFILGPTDINPILDSDIDMSYSFIIKCRDNEELAEVQALFDTTSQRVYLETVYDRLMQLKEVEPPPSKEPEPKTEGNVEKVIRYYLKFLPPKNAVSILDVGCGRTAPYSGMLKNRAKRYVGLDIREGPKVDVVGDIRDLSGTFKNREFKWGWCTEVIEHIPEQDQIKAVREILRICRNCIFTYPKPNHPSFATDPTHHEVKVDWKGLFSKTHRISDNTTRNGRAIFMLEVKK